MSQVKFLRTAPPVGKAITLGKAKDHLNITQNDDDAVISAIIDEATAWCENYMGRPIVQQTWTRYLDCWTPVIYLPISPVASVSVNYTDVNGQDVELPADQYTTDLIAEPALVVFTHDAEPPELADGFNTIRCDVVAGWPDAQSLPYTLTAAVKLMIGHLYENREATTNAKIEELPAPFGVRTFLNSHRTNF